MKNIIERFEEKFMAVPESGCYLWMAGTKSNGYGQFTMNGKEERAHRAAYMLYIGEIPDGKQVLHKCDVPLCVNPDHLFIGSVQDNMTDKVSKNRQQKGLNHGCCTVNSGTVLGIKEALTNGDMQKHIAIKYGVSNSMVSEIKHGKRYTEVI